MGFWRTGGIVEHMEGKHAMERNQGMKGVPVAFFLKSLLFSYILTGALLALLAFLLYRFGLGERVVSIAIIAIYVVATFFSGFVAGKRMESRRFFLGAFDGGRLFSGAGCGLAGGGEGGCAGGEVIFYDAGVVCRRGDAWGDVELK